MKLRTRNGLPVVRELRRPGSGSLLNSLAEPSRTRCRARRNRVIGCKLVGNWYSIRATGRGEGNGCRRCRRALVARPPPPERRGSERPARNAQRKVRSRRLFHGRSLTRGAAVLKRTNARASAGCFFSQGDGRVYSPDTVASRSVRRQRRPRIPNFLVTIRPAPITIISRRGPTDLLCC